MKATYFSTLITALTLASAPAVRAQHCSAGKTGPMPHYHTAAPLGSGIVRTYVVPSKAKGGRDGKQPDQIGIEIPAEVMNNLPATTVAMASTFQRPRAAHHSST